MATFPLLLPTDVLYLKRATHQSFHSIRKNFEGLESLVLREVVFHPACPVHVRIHQARFEFLMDIIAEPEDAPIRVIVSNSK